MKMGRIEKLFVNSKRRQRSRVAQAKRLLSALPLENVRDYLEVGCGAGAVTRFVASELGLRATGIDIDPEQIALARKGSAGVANTRFQEGDATSLPFEDQSFDVVLSFMATHHIEGVDAALHEIARVLKPGGHFVYADIFLPSIIAGIGTLVGHSYHLPPSKRLLEALRANGFATVTASRSGEKFLGQYEAVLRRRNAGPDAPAISSARASSGTTSSGNLARATMPPNSGAAPDNLWHNWSAPCDQACAGPLPKT